jgi:hypothetical protein
MVKLDTVAGISEIGGGGRWENFCEEFTELRTLLSFKCINISNEATNKCFWAARSKAPTVLICSKSGYWVRIQLATRHGVCLEFFCVVLTYALRGTEMGRSQVHIVLTRRLNNIQSW